MIGHYQGTESNVELPKVTVGGLLEVIQAVREDNAGSYNVKDLCENGLIRWGEAGVKAMRALQLKARTVGGWAPVMKALRRGMRVWEV